MSRTADKVMQLGTEAGDKHIMMLPFHIGGYSHFWAFYSEGAMIMSYGHRSRSYAQGDTGREGNRHT
jgi:hypothetical protein